MLGTIPIAPMLETIAIAPMLETIPIAPMLETIPIAPMLETIPIAPMLETIPIAPMLGTIPIAPMLGTSIKAGDLQLLLDHHKFPIPSPRERCTPLLPACSMVTLFETNRQTTNFASVFTALGLECVGLLLYESHYNTCCSTPYLLEYKLQVAASNLLLNFWGAAYTQSMLILQEY